MSVARILLNCPDIDTARVIAAALLDEKLVASANIHPAIESHYVWQGDRVSETEVPLVLKTRADLLKKIEERIDDLHPYEVPPLVAQHLDFVTAAYAAWVEDVTDAP